MEPVKKKKAKSEKNSSNNGGVSELELKINELTEALQRERADAQNLIRRAEEEKIKLSGFYKAQVIKELLPVLDAAEKALELSSKEKLDKTSEGMSAVLVKLKKTLENLGLERIEAEGKKFDENLHDAISIDESNGERDVVTKDMQAGYRLGDEILRHSMVVVRR
ncbi:MAG: nucleotide exchange factor GrpE [Candidatus Nomurabacteria bacterium]|nr:MAG: nucleotide exchange factor GrpE [Candidatus Nomurabacteria bacterium]HRV75951.1 nucleotide exchange factor GrpE [Candidatus Saccharimonadales bacterium]